MDVRADERGQSIQIGAVLLFAFLVLAFATYQAILVPQQNAVVEANHAQLVSDDMVELRSAVVDAWATGITRSGTVHLGTTYPPRVIALNPGPPGGTLRTGVAGAITVVGPGNSPNAICGSESVQSRILSYTPQYNEYGNAPTVVYENSVVYRRYPNDVLFDSEQRIIQDETVNIIPLASSYERSGSSGISIDSVAGNRTVTFAEIPHGEDLEVTFPSSLSAATWNDTLLEDQPHVIGVSKTDDAVTIRLNGSQMDEPPLNYTLVCRKIGLDRAP